MDGADGFWAKLGPAERVAIERIATRRRFAPGDFLCREGDRSHTVFVVLSGHVRVLASGLGAREVVVAVRMPGDILGELATLDDGPRSATLQALDAVEALVMPGPRFTTLCQTQPRLAWVLLGVIAGRLREGGWGLVAFGGGSAMHRVVALLLELAVRHGKPVSSGIEIATPGTQEDLASTAAISRESLSRVLRELRERGVISTGRGRMTIHRMAELRRIMR